MMKVDGFMRHEGIHYVMVLKDDGKIISIPATRVKGYVVKGSILKYDVNTLYYIVVGETECESCGLEQLGGDNK